MVGGQQGGEVALGEATLLAGLLDNRLASGDVAGLGAASLELLGAVGERGTLGRLEVGAALGSLLGDIVTGVSSREASKEGKAGSLGEKHGECIESKNGRRDAGS